MPSSANRHRIEIPTALFERLEGRARGVGMTVAALAAALLADALDGVDQAPARAPRPAEDQFQDLREGIARLVELDARQLQELRALREEVGAQLRVVNRLLPHPAGARDRDDEPAASGPPRKFALDNLQELRVAERQAAQPRSTPATAAEWRELRVAEQGAWQGAPFVDAVDRLLGEADRSQLSPEWREYIRLLLGFTQSPQLRESYARQAEVLRRRLQDLPGSEPPGGEAT